MKPNHFFFLIFLHIHLGEEVQDCGLIVDLEKTPDCTLLEDQYDQKAEFPECCPVYDCTEGAEIVYKNKAGVKTPRKTGE